MAVLLGDTKWNSNPVCYWNVTYDYYRSGSNVVYTIKVNAWTTSSGAWYNNIWSAWVSVDNVERGTYDIKGICDGCSYG